MSGSDRTRSSGLLTPTALMPANVAICRPCLRDGFGTWRACRRDARRGVVHGRTRTVAPITHTAGSGLSGLSGATLAGGELAIGLALIADFDVLSVSFERVASCAAGMIATESGPMRRTNSASCGLIIFNPLLFSFDSFRARF